MRIMYSTTDEWGTDGAWWEGDVDLDAEARAYAESLPQQWDNLTM